MTLIEGIGDEVTHFFIGIIIIITVSLAWWTTNVSEQRGIRTVFLLERRRLRSRRNLTSHTQSSEIIEEDRTNPPNSETENKPPQAGTSTGNSSIETEIPMRSEEEEIVTRMDAETPSLNRITTNLDQDGVCPIKDSTENRDVTPSAPLIEDDENIDNGENNELGEGTIRVKLKFLNDELRLVSGKLQEKLGEFKQRHFQSDLALNKSVKLIFNGHVLQQDADTLGNCGLFDNCVVHCLIHQRSQPESGSQTRTNDPIVVNLNSSTQNQQHEWHLENYLLAALCCFLLGAWYLRYVYSHLYTVTATIGLTLMTGLFTIIVFGMHFPDFDQLNIQRTENA